MAKSITNKITTERKLAINGFLDIDSLDKGMILVDTEEEGTVDLLYYLTNFNGKNIRLSISEKSEEEVKVSQDTEEEESTEE
ncbi:MAG: hypothetical protein SPI06_15350 [Terrisporobacter sp.]|uniref:hypothetical protein n=1 Tax=Terrisporobacter sp. TaxID=1965305 RepID=UPI002A90E25B|nr:hypothetical protein [Terrisporobacter sp.]MDY6154775.1 hypothetical protein [Terrisporobacter sp.]